MREPMTHEQLEKLLEELTDLSVSWRQTPVKHYGTGYEHGQESARDSCADALDELLAEWKTPEVREEVMTPISFLGTKGFFNIVQECSRQAKISASHTSGVGIYFCLDNNVAMMTVYDGWYRSAKEIECLFRVCPEIKTGTETLSDERLIELLDSMWSEWLGGVTGDNQ